MTILQALDRQLDKITLNKAVITREQLLSNNWECNSADESEREAEILAETASMPMCIDPFMPVGIQAAFPHDRIRVAGCFFLSCIKYGEIIRNRAVSTQEILDLYESCVRDGIIERSTFVNNSPRLVNRVLGRIEFRGDRRVPPSDPLSHVSKVLPLHIIRLFRERDKATHFIVSNHGEIWDSLDPNRSGASEYEATEIRWFV